MTSVSNPEEHLQAVCSYYGKGLRWTSDLKTSACCPVGTAPPPEHLAVLKQLHPEVTEKFYGCGSPIPPHVEDATVLDLGCGTGRDVYLLSGLVGTKGRVIGVDMTKEQLDVAREHQDYHAKVLLNGADSNVELRHGYIEDLEGAGVEESSVDIVISNCVCNLSPDKKKVFSQVARALKDGGEFYFSDIYADRRLSEEAQKDKDLVGECLGGALYLNDFVSILREAGLSDPRIVSAAAVQVEDERLKGLVPDVQFYSLTVRIFKLPRESLESELEEYGETATYNGPKEKFVYDSIFTFAKGQAQKVDATTAEVLRRSRYAQFFEVSARGPHRGIFAPKSYFPSIAFMLRAALPASEDTSANGQATSGCCGSNSSVAGQKAQSAKQNQTSNGCCGPKAKAKTPSANRCCAPKSSPTPSAKASSCCSAKKRSCC